MKLNVPFYKQTTALNCGPTALKMVLAYFGEDLDINLLEKRIGIKKGKGIYTIQIATAAASLGFKTDFYSKCLLLNEENLKLDFYKKYAENIDLEESKKWIEDAKKAGVNLEEKTLTLEELLSKVSKASVPIVLLDWNVVKGKEEKGYQGHFVPIVGYDKTNVYLHNHGLNETQKFMSVTKEIFEKARKAKGTDEDVLIVYRK